MSKFGGGLDADVTFCEFEAIVNATGHRAKVLVFEKGSTLVDEVKSHARAIKRLLDKLVALAGTDDVLVHATKGFLDTAAFNLLRVVEQAAVNLPPFADA